MKSQPIFLAIRLKGIRKFILVDITTGTLVYLGIERYTNSTLLSILGSSLSIEIVNQFIKRKKS